MLKLTLVILLLIADVNAGGRHRPFIAPTEDVAALNPIFGELEFSNLTTAMEEVPQLIMFLGEQEGLPQEAINELLSLTRYFYVRNGHLIPILN